MFGTALFSLLLAQSALAAAPAVGSPPAVVQMSPAIDPWADQFDIASRISGRTYRIYVSRPLGPPPKDGWPVIYVTDGDMIFSTVASQNVYRNVVQKSTAIIVGIGYPDAAKNSSLRQRDFTPSQPKAEISVMSRFGTQHPENFGGAELFHRFMTEELRPIIAAKLPINASDQTLMGFSLGGLYTVHVLLQHPDAYRTFVAISPSIWWNGREVLKDEASFSDAVRAGRVAPRVLITVAAYEQDPDRHDNAGTVPREELVQRLAESRMVDNARDLAARLSALHGRAGYRVEGVVFPGETHVTGLPAAASRGYAFAMTP